MKIISKFHDYYDSVMAHDRDPYPLYMRTHAKYEDKDRLKVVAAIQRKAPTVPNLTRLYRPDVGRAGFVAFCGKLYPFWQVGGTACYSIKQFIKATELAITTQPQFADAYKELRKRLHEPGTKLLDYHGHYGELNCNTYDQWATTLDRTVPDEIFLAEKAPVLALEGRMVYINPCLKTFNFQTVVDPYTAYQELSMFLGNNMAQQLDPIPKTTDKLKAHAHGFDDWSFRTHKEDSKKSKRRKEKQAVEPAVVLDDSDFEME